MLTGQQAFARETEFLMFRAINQEPRPRVGDLRGDVPAAIDDAITKALSRNPADRFATARDFGDAVTAAVAHLGGPLGMAAIGTELRRLCGDQIEARKALIVRRAAIIDSGRTQAKASAERELPDDDGAVSVVEKTKASSTTRSRSRRWVLLGVGAATLAALLVFGPRLVGCPRASGPAARVVPPGLTLPVVADAGAAPPASAPATAPASLPASRPAPATAAAPPSPLPPPPVPTHKPAPAHAQPGYFTIDSKPYATIFVDGRKLGETPLFRVRLAPGTRRVKAVIASGKTQTFSVTIQPGKQAPPRRLEW
jgi:serine/threonine-protein kinase